MDSIYSHLFFSGVPPREWQPQGSLHPSEAAKGGGAPNEEEILVKHPNYFPQLYEIIIF